MPFVKNISDLRMQSTRDINTIYKMGMYSRHEKICPGEKVSTSAIRDVREKCNNFFVKMDDVIPVPTIDFRPVAPR